MKQPRKSPEPHPLRAVSRPLGWLAHCVPCLLLAGLLCAHSASAAQLPKPSPPVAQNNTPAPAPTASTSLADQPPTAATVTFSKDQLTIHANNSTLLQIFQAVTAQTGMQVQGTPGNHRIFGVYGPGRPAQVLTQLLTGFGFNYLLIGAAPNGAPRTLLLAGTALSMPEPTQPVHSIQPAPQNPYPQPHYRPRPYYPRGRNFSRRPDPARTPAQTRTSPPHTVPSVQQYLKQLEAMHAKQQGSSH